MANERRHADRAAVKLDVKIKNSEREWDAIIGNIGPAGAFIECVEVMKVGDKIQVTFPLLPFRTLLTVNAEVRWKKSGENGGFGVHFQSVRELDQLAIHDYVLILLAKRRHRQFDQ